MKPNEAPKSGARRVRSGAPSVSAEERHKMISETAYYKAEQRGFEAGNEEQDWYDAEREVDERLGANND